MSPEKFYGIDKNDKKRSFYLRWATLHPSVWGNNGIPLSFFIWQLIISTWNNTVEVSWPHPWLQCLLSSCCGLVVEILFLYSNNIHFTCNGQFYIQVYGVTMGFPLAPLLTKIFKMELERSLISNLCKIEFWRFYLSNPICFIIIGSIEYIISVLKSFLKNNQITYEVESNAKLFFSDVLLRQNDGDIKTIVCWNESSSEVYLH